MPFVGILQIVAPPPNPMYLFGSIYDLKIGDAGEVSIVMTLTAPTCPVAEEMPSWIQTAIEAIEGVSNVTVEVVWEPFWKLEYMSEAARLELGLF